MRFVTFENSHLEEAASVLVTRHKFDRSMNPELPSKFEDVQYAKKAIEVLYNEKSSFGIAAMIDSKLVGYMIGSIHTDKNRERHTWIKYAGMAIDNSVHTELYRELYAEFAKKMVDHGSFNHYVMLPSGNKSALDAWLYSGFAFEQVHGIRDMSLTDKDFDNLQIRLANKDDEKKVRELATIIMEHQTKSPVFAPGFVEEREDYQEGYAELIDDETTTLWLALHQNEIVGFQVFEPAAASDENLLTPESCISLVVGATIESARGMGVSTALLHHGLNFAKKDGFKFCETDWRITNLESSRFWTKNGFKPIAYRLVRKIDPRITWATGN